MKLDTGLIDETGRNEEETDENEDSHDTLRRLEAEASQLQALPRPLDTDTTLQAQHDEHDGEAVPRRHRSQPPPVRRLDLNRRDAASDLADPRPQPQEHQVESIKAPLRRRA